MNSKQTSPNQILSYLYLGNKADAKSKEILQSLNIRFILNCTPKRSVDPEAGCPNFYEKEKIFTYKRIPIFDNKGEDILSHMNTSYKFIEDSRHHGNILVHCKKGVSRSAAFVIGYLMIKNEFTFDEALTYVQSCRPIVMPNTSFITQLQSLESSDKMIPLKNSSVNNDEISTSIGPSLGPTLPIQINNESIRDIIIEKYSENDSILSINQVSITNSNTNQIDSLYGNNNEEVVEQSHKRVRKES
eukprot:gene8993-12132_t